MKSGWQLVCVCLCFAPADLDGRGAAPVSKGKQAPGAVFQSSLGEGHHLLPAAPSCDDTLTPSLTRSACMHMYCTYVHALYQQSAYIPTCSAYGWCTNNVTVINVIGIACRILFCGQRSSLNTACIPSTSCYIYNNFIYIYI